MAVSEGKVSERIGREMYRKGLERLNRSGPEYKGWDWNGSDRNVMAVTDWIGADWKGSDRIGAQWLEWLVTVTKE